MKKKIMNILSYVLVIVIALLIKQFVFSPIKVNGSSMYPTLRDGDIMFLNEIGYHLNGLKRFDIVVVNTENDRIIKRVIGLPGEYVEYKDNILYINGEEVKENFDHEITHNFKLDEIGHDKIPDGYYFVVGDNRGDSLDSRKIGLISKDQIKGKTDFILLPFKRLGKVN